jgi:hypothetical protein
MLARKKSLRHIKKKVYAESEGFSFTFTDAEDYAASGNGKKCLCLF